MKRLVIIAATLFALSGLAYAGGPTGPEQHSYPQGKVVVVQPPKPDDGWTTGNKIAAAGVVVTAMGIAAGLYLNSRRKK